MSPSDDDEERTIVRPPSQRSAAAPLGHTLPIGTHLRDYEITGLIGEGGFGIVYLAWDHSLQRKVAIKEYMPASMASRVAGSSAIVVKSDRHLDTFKAGLKSFVNEARLLARFDHPSLVKVYRFWEENGTAYMAMPFYEGPTLKAALAELGHVPSEAELRAWLNPLLDALTVMHAAQCFHRDIAPDNILITATGPLLLDFGAARRVIGDMTHALTVVLKPGYAPIEQYGDVASMTQGAWTDIYALGCVVYYAITGKTPMSSVERLMDDRLEPLAVAAAGRYGDGFLRAIDAALAVKPQARPQNEAEFRALLDVGLPPAAPPSSGFGTLSHEAYAPTERGYGTVPGTLTPVLATQLLDRPAEAPAPSETHLRSDFAPAEALAPGSLPTPLDEWPGETPLPGPAAAAAPAKGKGGAIGVALVLAAIGLGAGVYWALQPGTPAGVAPTGPPASAVAAPAPVAPAPVVPAPAPAARPSVAAPPVAAPAIEVPPVSPPLATPASAAAPMPAVAEPAPPVASAAMPTAAAPAVAAEPKVHEAPVTTPPVRPRREAPARVETPVEAKPPPTRRPGGGARCSDILQKASLEPLTAEEAAYLKRECR
ncbi:MAG: serine/threonine protein kinase [Caldimonas sp.]